MNPNTQIFCDMDGVLVDFLDGASQKMNAFLSRAQLNGSWMTPAEAKIYRKILRDHGPDVRISSEEDLRQPGLRNLMFMIIAKDPGEFFSQLGTLHDGTMELWPFINSTGHSVSLLTAGVPGNKGTQPADAGKRIWANRELRPNFSRFLCVPAVEKRQFAMEGGVPNILIDDKLRTIDQWNEDGGYGILHVTGRSDITIKNLKALGL